MLTHEQIWRAIDRLATTSGYSASGLAKQAGLDSTSFNKSKRTSPDGKPRWPSTESISRILGATGASLPDFISLVDQTDQKNRNTGLPIPMIDFSQAGSQNFFDEKGMPQGVHWNGIRFPEFEIINGGQVYALKINDNSMAPLYREGSVLVVSPQSKIRIGDRIVMKAIDGEIMVKEMTKQNASRIEVKSLNLDHENRKIPIKDIAWTARVIWASQ